MITDLYLEDTKVTIEFSDGTKDIHEHESFEAAFELFDYIGQKYNLATNYESIRTNITRTDYTNFKRAI